MINIYDILLNFNKKLINFYEWEEEDNIKYVTYMGPGDKTNPKNGFARIEIDNELIQGATVYITYEISVDNISEIDYYNSEYYLYGNIKNESDIIKIKPITLDKK